MALTLARIALLILMLSPLYGCVDAAVSGAQAAYDHNNLQKKLQDHYLAYQTKCTINDSKHFENANVSVAVFNRVMLITGQVPKPAQRAELDQIVKKIHDIKEVYNFTTVSSPASTLTQASDDWITTKIKSKLIAANEVDPSQIKVVTEDGTVYLMGIVRPSQAHAAIYLARTTEGVQNVVKIFRYLKISKTD